MDQAEIKHALKDWRSIVKQYQQPCTKKAVLQIFTSFPPFLLMWGLMYYSLNWHYGITLLLAGITAFFLVRIFIIQHDCGHQSFLKSRKWNHALGYFSSVFNTIPYIYWAKVHNAHHGHNSQLEHRGLGDTYFLTSGEFRKLSIPGKLFYRLLRTPVVQFLVLPIIYLIVSNRYPFFKVKEWGKVHWPLMINNLAIVLVNILLAFLIGWKEFLLIQLPVLYAFVVIAFWFFYVQHQHENNYYDWHGQWDFLLASILGSTFYKLPRIFQWLTGNIGYHHIHHLNSRIPSYHLVRCAEENPILTKYVCTLTFRESLKCMTYKLWDEEERRMISFREYYRKGSARSYSEKRRTA